MSGHQRSDPFVQDNLRAGATSAEVTAGGPPARADITITATTQALTALIFARSDAGVDITGETGQSNGSGKVVSSRSHPRGTLAL